MNERMLEYMVKEILDKTNKRCNTEEEILKKLEKIEKELNKKENEYVKKS